MKIIIVIKRMRQKKKIVTKKLCQKIVTKNYDKTIETNFITKIKKEKTIEKKINLVSCTSPLTIVPTKTTW